MPEQSLHALCRWTFNPGKGGFTPGDIRPAWAGLDAEKFIEIAAKEIRPRLPGNIRLGVEFHYDSEIDEKSAPAAADALVENGMSLAMLTPGAHARWAYGGIASLDEKEREEACDFGLRTVELAYGPLRKAWHPEEEKYPSFVLWNGSWGYDIASPCIRNMYENLKESVASLCGVEKKKGGKLYFAIEPKPNEGHPAMLIPTAASAILFWRKLEEEYSVSRVRKGVNKEFGHSEMAGLDHVYDTVEEIDSGALVHMHVNSQGYNDGITLGGPGKFDIDHGVRINGMNIAVAGLARDSGYCRWKGHDIQPRPYDDEKQAVDRVVRSILSWEACERAAAELNREALAGLLAERETAGAEDLIAGSVSRARRIFDELYG